MQVAANTAYPLSRKPVWKPRQAHAKLDWRMNGRCLGQNHAVAGLDLNHINKPKIAAAAEECRNAGMQTEKVALPKYRFKETPMNV